VDQHFKKWIFFKNPHKFSKLQQTDHHQHYLPFLLSQFSHSIVPVTIPALSLSLGDSLVTMNVSALWFSWHFIFVLLLTICRMACNAHRPMLTRPSCDSDYGSSQAALKVPDATISWSFKHYADCTNRALWIVVDKNPYNNFYFYVGVGVPTLDRFASVRVDAVVIGPELPTLNSIACPKKFVPNRCGKIVLLEPTFIPVLRISRRVVTWDPSCQVSQRSAMVVATSTSRMVKRIVGASWTLKTSFYQSQMRPITLLSMYKKMRRRNLAWRWERLTKTLRHPSTLIRQAVRETCRTFRKSWEHKMIVFP
jgi:hypothetical protein